MKILPLSDLHLDHHADRGETFLANLDPTGVDVLVLAGDITYTRGLKDVLEGLADRFPHVIFVPGNHDHYHFNSEQAKGPFHHSTKYRDNLHWLNQSTVTIKGARFIGATLWFPRPPRTAEPDYYPDFRHIKNFRPWVYDEHQATLGFLRSELQPTDMLVTHFLPLRESLAFKTNSLNCFFWSGKEADKLVRERGPRLAIHGHTHFSRRYRVGPTEVVCNPLGYPTGPNREFDEHLVIEV